ncbi:hypothetical protein [Actinomadura keratinilytica]|uniref:Uncharacterized protein n=1 Tax=Actinomadura keratinilytica TaxID=547461 RepID=A0ABP7Z5Z2_9ACTN
MGEDRGDGERGCWAGPGGVRVTAVRLVGAHRVWADAAGVPAGVPGAFLVTDGGARVGRGYYPTVEELSEVVDLASLRPCDPGT